MRLFALLLSMLCAGCLLDVGGEDVINRRMPGAGLLRRAGARGGGDAAKRQIFGIYSNSNAQRLTQNGFNVMTGNTSLLDHYDVYRTVQPPSDMAGKAVSVHWQPGYGLNLYERMRADLSASRPVSDIVWCDSFNDANTEAYANALAATYAAFKTQIEADTGFSGYWFHVLLHTSAVATYAATARTQDEAWVASDARVFGVDPDSIPVDASNYDGTHYGTTGRALLAGLIEDAVNAARGY